MTLPSEREVLVVPGTGEPSIAVGCPAENTDRGFFDGQGCPRAGRLAIIRTRQNEYDDSR
jgi:hypothetical protein